MEFFRRLLSFWRKKENTEETPGEEPKSFFLYIMLVPQIVTYLRREKGISRRDLELVLMDNEEQPAWQIYKIAELVITDLNLMYIVTGRPDAFEKLAEEVFEERGLLLVLLKELPKEGSPGNLVLDLRDWEKHLDIARSLSYNTLNI